MNYYFSNEINDYFKNINKLPDELIDLIKSYTPEIVFIFLSKEYYLEKHYLIKKYINKRHIENYIRCMIRQDNDFVFGQMLVENWKRWINMKKYYYKRSIYSNYLNFLEEYCLENYSTRCRKLITILLEEQGLSKNQHKKNILHYIRWKT
jgi:hypothetical protein